MEPPIKDTPIKNTIEITSEQRTRFNVPNGDFPIVLIIIIFLTSQPLKQRTKWPENNGSQTCPLFGGSTVICISYFIPMLRRSAIIIIIVLIA